MRQSTKSIIFYSLFLKTRKVFKIIYVVLIVLILLAAFRLCLVEFWHHNIIFTVRDEKKGKTTLSKITNSINVVDYVVMDVSDQESMLRVGEQIKSNFDRVDILFNNAGILLHEYQTPALETPEESILKTFDINTLNNFV